MSVLTLLAFFSFSFQTLFALNSNSHTDFVRFEKNGQYPLLSFKNSTSKVNKIGLHLDSDAYLLSVSRDSTLFVDGTTLFTYGQFTPFSVAGQLELSSFAVSPKTNGISVRSLMDGPSPDDVPDFTASVTLQSSLFSNLPLSSDWGTFVSTGVEEKQTVLYCSFENITILEASENGRMTMVDKCTVDNCVFSGCQDTFYGLIVSGMSPKTTHSFSTTNSTYERCVRQNPLTRAALLAKLQTNGNCASNPKDGSTTTGQTIGCRSTIDNTLFGSGTYTFVSCTFGSCQSPASSSGGAIYQTKGWTTYSEKLSLSKCTFTSCTATVHGGAVFSEYVNNQYVTECQFIACSVPNGKIFYSGQVIDHDAGALLLNFTDNDLVLRNSNFSRNAAGGRGGGAYLGNIQLQQTGHLIDSCIFEDNVAKFDYIDKPVAAGIGGGFYALPINDATYGGCIFRRNTAGWHGGGIIFARSKAPLSQTLNWFIFSDNKGYSGCDIYVRAPTMYQNITDWYTFTDYPNTNRYEFNISTNESLSGFHDDWLEVGPAEYVRPAGEVPYYIQNGTTSGTYSCRMFNNTACTTVAPAVADGKKYSTVSTRVYLSAGEYTENQDIQVLKHIVYFYRFTTKETKLNLGGTISVSSGYAIMRAFTITITGTNTLAEITNAGYVWAYSMTINTYSADLRDKSLFVLGSGELYMSSCTVTNFKQNDCPLISRNPTSTIAIEFYNTTFTSISRAAGSGSVLETTAKANCYVFGLQCVGCTSASNGGAVAITIEDANKVFTLSGCSFTNCACGSNGGAVYVDIKDAKSTIRLLDSTSFTTTDAATSTPDQGRYVYIDCKDGEFVGTPAYWDIKGFSSTMDEAQRKYYHLNSQTYGDTTRKHYSLSLYYFVYAPADVTGTAQMDVNVDEGADIRTCGWSNLPCKTIYTAFDQRGSIAKLNLIKPTEADGYPTGNQTFAVLSTLTVASSQEEKANYPKVLIDSWSSTDPIFTIKNDETTFQQVAITVKTDLRAPFATLAINSTITTNQPSLTLRKVTITASKDAESSYSPTNYFLRAMKGTITVEDSEISNFALSNTPFFGLPGSEANKLTLSLTRTTFDSVTSTRSLGSVFSLSASTYATIALDTVTFTDCTANNGENGAIYDNKALDTGHSTITFKDMTFQQTGLAVKQYVYFEEPGSYLFSSASVTQWKNLIGVSAGSEYSSFSDEKSFYRAKASGNNEPAGTFSLVHLCFDPPTEEVFVAGKVDGIQEYFNMDSYQYKKCGWEDIPCMTVKQALAATSTPTQITLKSGIHEAETSTVTIPATTVKGVSTTKAVSSVTETAVFSIGAASTFSTLAFDVTVDQTIFSVSSGGSLTLQRVNFAISSSGLSHLIVVSSAAATSLIMDGTNTFQSDASFGPGAYIYIEKSNGAIFHNVEQLTSQFPATSTTSNDSNLYLVDETDYVNPEVTRTRQTASLAHFIHAPIAEGTGASELYVSNGGADIDTCGWSDIPCLTLAKAITEGHRSSFTTVVINSDYTIQSQILHPPSGATAGYQKELIIRGLVSEPESSSPTLSVDGITDDGTDGNAVFTIGTDHSLSLASLAFNFACSDLTGTYFTSSGTLSLDDVSCDHEDLTLTYSLFSLQGGSLTIANSEFQKGTNTLKLQSSMIATAGTVSVTLIKSQFRNIAVTTGSDPALLFCASAETKLTFVMDSCEVQNLASETREKGGAIYINQQKDSSVKILSSTLSKCKCAAAGRGDFIYLEIPTDTYKTPTSETDPDLIDLLVSSVSCTHRNDIAKRNGLQLFIDCGTDKNYLKNRIDSSMFVVDLTGDGKSSDDYSFWGKTFTDEKEVDLLQEFSYFTAKVIFVDHATTATDPADKPYENVCGAETLPCKSLDIGAKHVLTSGPEESYIKFVQATGETLSASSTLKDLTLCPQAESPAKSELTVVAAIASSGSISISGKVAIERIAFKGLDAINTDSFFDTTALSDLTFTTCTFEATGTVSKSFISLKSSSLKMDGVTVNALSLSKPFIVAEGLSGREDAKEPVFTIELSKCTFSDIAATTAFVQTTSSTFCCENTKFLYASQKSVPNLFNLGGDSVITDCVIGCSDNPATDAAISGDNYLTLGDSLIKMSGAASLAITGTSPAEDANPRKTTRVSAIKLNKHSLIEPASTNTVTLAGCDFLNLVHNDGDDPSLFATTVDSIKNCQFKSITQGTKNLIDPQTSLSASDCNFYFASDNAKNIFNLYGGSTLTSCNFQETDKGAFNPAGTLITITPTEGNTNAVSIVKCQFRNIHTPSSALISSAAVSGKTIKIIFNQTKLQFAAGSALKTFVTTDGDLEFVNDCEIKPFSSGGEASSTTASLVVVKQSLYLSELTLTGLTLGSPLIDFAGSGQNLTIVDSNFDIYTADTTTIFSTGTPKVVSVGGSTFVAGSAKFNLLEAPDGASFTNCIFKANSSTTPPTSTTLSTSILAVKADATVTFSHCEFTNLVSSQPFISGTTGTVIVNGETTFDFASGTLSSPIISLTGDGSTIQVADSTIKDGKLSATSLLKAKTIQIENDVEFINLDHSAGTQTLLDGAFTIADCTFKDIVQDSAAGTKALLSQTGATIMSNTKFIYDNKLTSMQNVLELVGGSLLTSCTFEPAEGKSLTIQNTVISLSSGSGDVTFDSCKFTNIASTESGKAVIDCTGDLQIIITDTTFTFITDASLYSLLTTAHDVEFANSAVTVVSGTATLHAALFSLKKDASLKLTNSNISSFVLTGSDACLITTDEKEENAANSVTIDGTIFKDVEQSTTTGSTPTVPIFNTPQLTAFKIVNCEFDCVSQAYGDYLLAAPTANAFDITKTKFYLPAVVQHPILLVSNQVTFSECHFGLSDAVKSETVGSTTLQQPLMEVAEGRTSITFDKCTFACLRAQNSTDKEDNVKGIPAILELTDSVTLTATDCSFTNVSSEIKIGQIFNAKTTADFTGCSFTETVIPEDDASDVCMWNASIVQLGGGTSTLKNTLFHNISAGALGISDGARVTITGWDFAENHPRIEGYTSMHRNLNCSGSTVTINDGTIDKSTSLYIISDDCTISFSGETPESTFFVPRLDSSGGKLDDKNDENLILTFVGENIIPCSLNFELFTSDQDTSGEKLPEPALVGAIEKQESETPSEVTVRFNADAEDKTATVEVTVDITGSEVYGKTANKIRLAYGDGKTTELKEMDPTVNFPNRRDARGGATENDDEGLSWWMYVIIGVGAFLLLLILVLIICCCCCRDDEKEEEDEDEDLDYEDNVKTVSNEDLMALNTSSLLADLKFKEFDSKTVTVEAMNTVAPFDKTVVPAKHSLYSYIHSPSHRQDHNPFMWASSITYHIATGVQHILDVLYDGAPVGSNELSKDVLKNILHTLCPHSIFFGEHESVLLGSVPNNHQVPVSANSHEGKTDFVFECQRYRSPEMTSHPNDDSRAMTESNAVFAIGFMMYEIFTGWLVFDGYPYSRVVEMVASGARPDLVLVRSVDSNFASIIDACTDMDAEQRPTIAQLLERIDMYLPANLRKGATNTVMPRSLMDDDSDDL